MAIAAAAVTLPLRASNRRSLSSSLTVPFNFSHYTPSSSRRHTLSFSVRLSSLRISAALSMSTEATEKAYPASFLDRKEGGYLHFAKYHGLGNDFILVDNRDSAEPKITPEQAVKLCDRNFGIGADGVIFTMPGTNGTDYTMRIFNSDGSEPEMCGNGIRCFTKFICELENLHGKQIFTVHTGAGLIVPERHEDGKVRVDMGEPVLKASDVPTKLLANKDQSVVKGELEVDGTTWSVTCVSMGNPHCVTFGTGNKEIHGLRKFDLYLGRANQEETEVCSHGYQRYDYILAKRCLGQRIFFFFQRGSFVVVPLYCLAGLCYLIRSP
ncbi:unnamed protein product [Cuscuta campestris]|uniref:diaminopimelate epimerase n=1 Tax=Cuscuta campestris TaxID=132261 RepID=A0A484K9D7_9ASTE|nr:unnamed protein product [Cuscuta campestris]